jgi:hypothetical protein
MNIPGFTGHASLYRTSARYRSSGSYGGYESAGDAIQPAYMPSPETMKGCNECMATCTDIFQGCLVAGAATCAAACVASGPLYPACYAACLGGSLGVCDLQLLGCEFGKCMAPRPEFFGWEPFGKSPCCPKPCAFPWGIGDPGQGCCDEGEHCVDPSDRNSRHGCCPSTQSVCGGRCCAPGDSCCGRECCPAGWFCVDGVCSQSAPFPTVPPQGKHRFGSGLFDCLPGWKFCKDKCCPPGLSCCHEGATTACRRDCLIIK